MKYFSLILTLCFGFAVSQGGDSAVSVDEGFAYAVNLGYPVTMSTKWDGNHGNYFLDNTQREGSAYSWSAGFNDVYQWIQVSSVVPQTWAGVITQGRGDWEDQWVTAFMIEYSNDGINWLEVDEGKVFEGNYDRDSYVKNWFDTPVLARTLRIKPISWKNHISMRFDALFYLNE